jgi:hypothetical protein
VQADCIVARAARPVVDDGPHEDGEPASDAPAPFRLWASGVDIALSSTTTGSASWPATRGPPEAAGSRLTLRNAPPLVGRIARILQLRL